MADPFQSGGSQLMPVSGSPFDPNQAPGSRCSHCLRWRSPTVSNASGTGMDRMGKFAMAATMLAGLLFVEKAHAIDLSGAWATDADKCRQVFIRKGRANQIAFTAFSDQHGGGFIVEADRLRGKFATCKIKTRKEDGQTVIIIAGCATDIMLSNVQFSLKVLEADKIARVFPGVPDLEIDYYRCPI
jgi:hypothetical protein